MAIPYVGEGLNPRYWEAVLRTSDLFPWRAHFWRILAHWQLAPKRKTLLLILSEVKRNSDSAEAVRSGRLMRRLVVTTVLLVLAALPSSSQEYAFHSLTVNDGLSQSHVDAIAQDHDGFIWFGTANGLNRYDGQNIVTFRHDPEDPTSLAHDGVTSLFVDDEDTLWVGTVAGISRMRKSAGSFETIQNVPGDQGSIAPGRVEEIVSGPQGSVWAATASYDHEQPAASVVNRIDIETGRAHRFPLDIDAGEVAALHVDASGTLWAGTTLRIPRISTERPGLFRFNGAMKTFERVFLAGDPNLGVLPIRDIIGNHHGKLLLATGGRSVSEFDPRTLATRWLGEELKSTELVDGSWIFDLAMDKSGVVWAVGAPPNSKPDLFSVQRQLLRIEPDGGVSILGHDPANPFAIGNGLMQVVFADKYGTLWIGTSGSGLRYADIAAPAFSLYRKNAADTNSLGSDFVRSVLAESDDRIWVGTSSGLDLVDRRARTVRHWVHEEGNARSILPGTVDAIFRDSRAQLWVTVDGGLHRFDPEQGVMHTYLHGEVEPGGSNNAFISTMAESDDGALWLAIRGHGLGRFDPANGDIRLFRYEAGDETTVPNNHVLAIRNRHNGRFWVLASRGLVDLDPKEKRLKRVFAISDVAGARTEQLFSCVHAQPGPPEVLWIGTNRGGLYRFVPETMEIEQQDLRPHGVLDNSVYEILPGDDGHLWMSTNFGLLRFDARANSYRLFASGRSLQAPEFNSHASHRGPTGELFFGGVAGLNAFRPETIVDNPIAPDVVITEVATLRRDTSQAGAEREVIYRRGQPPGLHRLAANQRDLVFDFVALHSSDASRNTVAYRLEGFETVWHEGRALRTAAYTNLDSGSYTFKVKAANADGVWNENGALFEFEILKPLPSQLWFRLSSALVLVAAGFAVFRLRVSAIERREVSLEARVTERTANLEQAVATIRSQAERLEELDAAKSRFFANVTHEFRTPLTLTIGPLEDLREGFHGPLPRPAVEDLDVAIRNARRLLHLVNQLLETAKLEVGQLRLQISSFDLASFLEDILLTFSPLAERREMTVSSEVPDEPVEVFADRDKMEQIFTNLLSNAFKFTPDGGAVKLRIGIDEAHDAIVVEVRDSGTGIPADLLPHIFDRFFQVDEGHTSRGLGSGIGLALTKELVELHGATIVAASDKGFGASFVVRFRRGSEHYDAADLIEVEDAGTAHTQRVARVVEELASRRGDEEAADVYARESQNDGSDTTTVLIVDDNAEIRSFVRKHLRGRYRVLEAENGRQGLDLTRTELPDLLISDVMMPEIDGIELCREVKKNDELAFIPVLLLSAKASVESRVTGLDVGADDYLTKPFEVRELQARVDNLIESRRRFREIVQTPGQIRSLHPNELAIDSEDQIFLERVRAAIEENLEDDTFGVEQLAWELSMSRVHLYRRLRDTLDQGPSEVIIGLRLDRAAQLLKAGSGNIAEIAYAVGFKAVSHFSKRFKTRFGKSPSAFRKSS